MLAPEAFRGVGCILVNHEGKRFVDELQTRDFVTNEILKNCKPKFGNFFIELNSRKRSKNYLHVGKF
jgi:aspartate oxidase